MKKYFKPEIMFVNFDMSDILTMSAGDNIYDDELPLVPFNEWSSI